MLKKIGTILLSGVILVSLSACDKKEEDKVKDFAEDLSIHVFCKDDCDEILEYLDTIDKDLYVKKHNISKEKEEILMEKVADYFGYSIDEVITPFTIINTKSILGFDDSIKEELKKTIKSEAKKEYKSIVEKLKKGESITDDKEDKKEEDKTVEEDKKTSDDKKDETTEKTYTVQSGDYLCKIAAMYDTTWDKIYNANRSVIGDDPNLIYPGQVLKVGNISTIKYTVQRGDYLCKIAAMYNTTWNIIYEDNKTVIGNNPNLIHPGQELTINN